jgi:protein-tyrosine phosphatase
MIDIHTHILPGVDDGVPDMGEALLLAEDAAAQGVTAMVATPHLHWADRPALSAAQIRQGVEQLNALLGAKGISLTVLPGCEIPLAPDLLRRLESDEWMSLGEGTRAVLVEPLWGEWPTFGQAVIKEMLDRQAGQWFWRILSARLPCNAICRCWKSWWRWGCICK